MTIPVCSTFMTTWACGNKTATHNTALYSPGCWSADFGHWVLEDPAVTWLQTNADCPSLSTDVKRGQVPMVQWLHHWLFSRIADTNSYLPKRRLKAPKAHSASRSSVYIWTLCSKSNIGHTTARKSWFSFWWLFSLDLSPIITKLVFNQCLTSWLISLISKGSFSQLR